MTSHRLLLSAAALSLFALSGCVGQDVQTINGVPYTVSDNVSSIEGVWQSRGYGWVVSLGPDGFEGSDIMEDYCISNPELTGPVEEFPAPFRISQDGEMIRISTGDPAYTYTFDKLDSLPTACSQPPSADPAAVFDAFDGFFKTHYAFFEERSIDWTALSDAARAEIAARDMGDEALYNLLSGLVYQIDDGHVSLSAEIDGVEHRAKPGRGKTGQAVLDLGEAAGLPANKAVQNWRRAVAADVETNLLGGKATITGNGFVRYGMIDDEYGYLGLMTMIAYSDEDDHAEIESIMDDVMTEIADAKAVIIDVSINHGGEDGISRRIARRFTDERSLAYSKYAADGEGEVKQDVYLIPGDHARYTGPVYLLTSDHTVSAGEIFTMAMRALPNVTHVGTTTRGSLSDILSKTLPNGWTLNLSNEVYLDSEGVLWEGRGVTPEIEIPMFSATNPSEGHAEAVREVVKLIDNAN